MLRKANANQTPFITLTAGPLAAKLMLTLISFGTLAAKLMLTVISIHSLGGWLAVAALAAKHAVSDGQSVFCEG